MDSHPPAADEPDTLASLQLLFSQIDSESRAQEVVDKAKDLSREETQLLVDALSTSLDKDNAFTRSQAHICLALVKIASATNIVSRHRTIKSENMTPSAGDDESLGIFTVTGQMPCQVKVVRRSQEDSSTVSGCPEDTVYAAQYSQNRSEKLIRWAHLIHPNILPLYATFSKDNNLGFVSPCLPEISICDHARRLQKEQRIPPILDVANGLSYLHRLNIVHGGLTPEAVLISSEGRALIAGLDATSEVEESDTLPTRYSAPEIFKDEYTRPTKPIDIWSFACFSYEVISGKAPFFQISKDTRISAAIDRGDKPLRPGREGVDGDEIGEDIWHVLLVCWEHGAGDRVSCLQVQEMLLNIPLRDDCPPPKLTSGLDTLNRYATDIERVRTVVARVLDFEPPSALQVPEHLRNSLYKLVDNANKRSARAAAAKKISPSETQVLVDFLDLSIHIPTRRLLTDIGGSTRTIPRSCTVKGVQFDLTTPIAEGPYAKAYKGRGLNIRVNVVINSHAETISDVINALVYLNKTWDMFVETLDGQRVLISNDGRAIVASFGSQFLFAEGESLDAYQRYRRRFVVPSLRYRLVQERSIWSFGCVFYEVLTRKAPYYQYPDDHEVVMDNSQAELPRRPNRSDNDIDEIDDKAWDLITKCCAQNPVDQASLSQIQEMVTDLGIEDNRPAAKPMVGPEVLALRSRPEIDFDQAESTLGKIQVKLLRDPLLKLIKNRTKDVAKMVAELESNDVRPVVDFLDQALKDQLSISDERNRILAILSRITSATHIFPHRYELNGVKYRPEPIAEVSPFMKNGNLRDYSPRLPQKFRLPLISDVVNGLHYLHELGIVHGDLKGQNILISDEGRGLITDFGASHITTATATSGSLSTTTLRFTAPEMLLGDKKPSKEFDIWSVGCLFYEVLSRKEPYYEYKYEVQIVAALSRKQPPMRPGTSADNTEEKDDWDDDFDQDWDTIDDQAWNLILKCCTPEPENRPNIATVKELVVDLKIWDDRPAAKTIPGAEILKLWSEPKIDLARVEELLDQLQSKLDVRPESTSLTVASP
ncbi:Cytokinesis protein sepH [Leucoagaricus sp. SymC.cos]|nr:Cytokinesis protein sepH [Leucoagaricus sp. SymC.cos]